MTFYFHKDKKIYFNHQYLNTKKYVISFIKQKYSVVKGTKILEIGCGEGGVLKAFLELGCLCTGVELDENKFIIANKLFRKDIINNNLKLIRKNIYNINFKKDLGSKFDLIILKDVIEHIENQKRLMAILKGFLKPKGFIYVGFPPWQMPFGGHQQICTNKILAITPYFHLLPNFLYKRILEIFGETNENIKELLKIKKTRISLEKFEDIIKKQNYDIINRKLYLINPIYEFKFRFKPREQSKLISKIPHLRSYLTTSGYYLIKPGRK